MKKTALSFVAAATLVSTTATAQKSHPVAGLRLPTQKGSVMTGSGFVLGEIGLGSTSNGRHIAGYYDVSLNPRVGYFIKDNLAAGIRLHGNASGTYNFHSESYGGSAFARRYFGKVVTKDGTMRRTRYFVEGAAGYTLGSAVFKNADGTRFKEQFSHANVSIMPGFNHFFTKNVAFEGGLYYSRDLYGKRVRTIGNVNHIGVNLGLQFFIGKR